MNLLRSYIRLLISETSWSDPDVVAFKQRERVVQDEDSVDIDVMNRSLASVKPISPSVNAGGPKSGRRPDGGRGPVVQRKYNAVF